MKVITAIEVICVISVIIYLIYDKIINSPTPQPLSEGVKAEVDEALEQIFLFRNENSFWKEEANLLMLLPENSTGELYAQDSRYIRIKLLLNSNPTDWFFSYTMPKYLDGFDFVVENGLEYIVRRTYVPYFELHYKKAMSQLYEHLTSKYPEYNWELDKGGRITIDLNKCSL